MQGDEKIWLADTRVMTNIRILKPTKVVVIGKKQVKTISMVDTPIQIVIILEVHTQIAKDIHITRVNNAKGAIMSTDCPFLYKIILYVSALKGKKFH